MKDALEVVAIVLFCMLDVAAYYATPYPERTSSWLYRLPGGGFVALLRFGRHSR